MPFRIRNIINGWSTLRHLPLHCRIVLERRGLTTVHGQKPKANQTNQKTKKNVDGNTENQRKKNNNKKSVVSKKAVEVVKNKTATADRIPNTSLAVALYPGKPIGKRGIGFPYAGLNAEKKDRLVSVLLDMNALKLMDEPGIQAYCDGSFLSPGMASAGAFLQLGGHNVRLHRKVQAQTSSDAEVAAAAMVLEYLENSLEVTGTPIWIWLLTDSRELVTKLEAHFGGAKTAEGPTLVLAKNLARLAAEGFRFRVIWVPGHCGLAGNDAADRTAQWDCGIGDLS